MANRVMDCVTTNQYHDETKSRGGWRTVNAMLMVISFPDSMKAQKDITATKIGANVNVM